MKIVHLCLGCFYVDNYSYQENLLPKYHKEMGLDVEIIASPAGFDKNGVPTCDTAGGTYLNEYGIPVTRLDYAPPLFLNRKLKKYTGLKAALEKAKPDIFFIHGCQFTDIGTVVRYLKTHGNITVYVDSHADFSNSATNWLSKNILHRIIWRHCAQRIEPYTKKFYGVLPCRVDFLVDMYRLPEEKCELLVMGGDDDLIREADTPQSRGMIREKYGLAADDLVIVSGGKIDPFKKQTLLLMEAVRDMADPKVKLLLFGSVTPELQDRVGALADGERVQYIGWLEAKETYKYFAAADLAVFPGRHSVFWEQVAAQGIPMICKRWAGTDDVDLGGNMLFLQEDTAAEIREKLEYVLSSPEVLAGMKRCAEKGREIFSYRAIAERSIADADAVKNKTGQTGKVGV